MITRKVLVIGVRERDSDEAELMERFAQFAGSQGIECVLIEDMQSVSAAMRYGGAIAHMTLQHEGCSIEQRSIAGTWYRGLPAIPAKMSAKDADYARRETEAFWEGYCHHAPWPILNRPGTYGLRPALWHNLLVGKLAQDSAGLPAVRAGVTLPSTDRCDASAGKRAYHTLSSCRDVSLDAAIGSSELCVWIEEDEFAEPLVVVHVGNSAIIARVGSQGAVEVIPAAEQQAWHRATMKKVLRFASRAGEEFGAARIERGTHGRLTFCEYAPNPAAGLLIALASNLFPIICNYFEKDGNK